MRNTVTNLTFIFFLFAGAAAALDAAVDVAEPRRRRLLDFRQSRRIRQFRLWPHFLVLQVLLPFDLPLFTFAFAFTGVHLSWCVGREPVKHAYGEFHDTYLIPRDA